MSNADKNIIVETHVSARGHFHDKNACHDIHRGSNTTGHVHVGVPVRRMDDCSICFWTIFLELSLLFYFVYASYLNVLVICDLVFSLVRCGLCDVSSVLCHEDVSFVMYRVGCLVCVLFFMSCVFHVGVFHRVCVLCRICLISFMFDVVDDVERRVCFMLCMFHAVCV